MGIVCLPDSVDSVSEIISNILAVNDLSAFGFDGIVSASWYGTCLLQM